MRWPRWAVSSAKRWAIVGLVLGLPFVQSASASDSPSQPPTPAKGNSYLVAFVTSTLVYRPPGGGFQGPQKDLTPAAGIGHFLSDVVAVELGLGPTLVTRKYKSLGLLSAVLWRFHRAVYISGRVIVPLHPEVNLLVLPSLGVTHALGLGIAPFFEIGLKSAVGRGRPDFGVAHAFGLSYRL